MGLHHIDPPQRPFWALYDGRRLPGDRDKVLVAWSLPDQWRAPSIWSILNWTVIAFCFGGTLLSWGFSLLGGIAAGGPVVGPWWWAGAGCLAGLLELAATVSLQHRRMASHPSTRLLAIRRLERPVWRHLFASAALSWRLLRRGLRGRHARRETVRLAPMWWIIAVPLILYAAPESVALSVGASVCGEASTYLPVTRWCHDAMAFAEARAWPPMAPNVTAAVGVIVVTKAAVWSSVVLSAVGFVSMTLRSTEQRLVSSGPVSRRLFALWLRLNPVRPASTLVVIVALVALYDTIARLAFLGAMAIVTAESVTAFVVWALTGAVFTHLALTGMASLIVARRIASLIQPSRQHSHLLRVE